MSSKASFNKNYCEKEYKTLSKRIWDAIDVCRDYEKIITPSEFFLAGFICANTDLRVAGRLFSLMIKNANTQERKFKNKFSKNEFDETYRQSRYSEYYKSSNDSYKKHSEKRKGSSRERNNDAGSANRIPSPFRSSIKKQQFNETPVNDFAIERIYQPDITQQPDCSIVIEDIEESETDDGELIELIINKLERNRDTEEISDNKENFKEQTTKKIASNGFSEEFMKLAQNKDNNCPLKSNSLENSSKNKRDLKEIQKNEENDIIKPILDKESIYKSTLLKLCSVCSIESDPQTMCQLPKCHHYFHPDCLKKKANIIPSNSKKLIMCPCIICYLKSPYSPDLFIPLSQLNEKKKEVAKNQDKSIENPVNGLNNSDQISSKKDISNSAQPERNNNLCKSKRARFH